MIINAKLFKQTKKGAASFFVTVFTILLICIIVLSFTRLILSEASQTSNNDLSQSAYDSALAGVEDAKTALLKYHDCLDKGYHANSPGSGGEAALCRDIIRSIQSQNCDAVAKALKRVSKPETGTVIQETTKKDGKDKSASMLQAYTCVSIQEELDNYRSTVSAENPLRVVPLRSPQINQLSSLRLRWFSETDLTKINKHSSGASLNFCKDDQSLPKLKGDCHKKHEVPYPPIVSAQIIQTDQQFSLSELSAASGDDNTNLGTVYIKPKKGSTTKIVPSKTLSSSSNKSSKSNPVQLTGCDKSKGGFYCEAKIIMPKTFRGSTERNQGASFLIFGLPYSGPSTDFSVEMLDHSDEPILFSGVQARVDSTGRANDLYRRVEARVELLDSRFPYPAHAVDLGESDEHDVLSKDFYVTTDCRKADDGKWTNCKNKN